MSDEPLPPFPPRLAGQDGETARLLRSAEPEFQQKLDESGAFRSIERTRRRRTVAAWGLACAGAAAAVVVLAQGAGRFGNGDAETTMTAEPLPPPRPADPIVTSPAKNEPAGRLPEAPPARPFSSRGADGSLPDEARCRKLAKAGEADRAVDCFRTLARGTGVGAEVASYEAARLSAETLHDAPRALRLLDEHKARFPAGAMRVEAGWLRIQSLERAGRSNEALSESEALLAAPEGRALSSDLHFLRARIYEARSDCQRASSELVALVGEKGARGDEAEMMRAACLERLGRKDDARAAYEQYLNRAEPRQADEARARIEALRP